MVLALVFLVTAGLTIGSLLPLVGGNLVDTRVLQHQRSLIFGAEAATDEAIQVLRPVKPVSPYTCPTFPADAQGIEFNGQYFVVQCQLGVPPGYYGRVAQFWACLAANASSCQADAVVETSVVYNDVNPNAAQCPSGSGASGSSCYGSYWGEGGVTYSAWTVFPDAG